MPKPARQSWAAALRISSLLPVLIEFGFSYRGCGNRALSIELIDAAEKG
jgi:hypothetical protein